MENNEKRRPRTYDEIKDYAADAYFDYCLEMLIVKKRDRGQIFSRLEDDLHCSDDHAIETLMINVVLYVLEFGWDAERANKDRKEIEDLLQREALDTLLRSVSEDEAQEFKNILKQLKLL